MRQSASTQSTRAVGVESMRSHLQAAAYLAIASAVVVIIEAHFGVRLATFWGMQFRNPVIYPLPFWLVTSAYAYFSARRTQLPLRDVVSRAILLGAWEIGRAHV